MTDVESPTEQVGEATPRCERCKRELGKRYAFALGRTETRTRQAGETQRMGAFRFTPVVRETIVHDEGEAAVVIGTGCIAAFRRRHRRLTEVSLGVLSAAALLGVVLTATVNDNWIALTYAAMLAAAFPLAVLYNGGAWTRSDDEIGRRLAVATYKRRRWHR